MQAPRERTPSGAARPLATTLLHLASECQTERVAGRCVEESPPEPPELSAKCTGSGPPPTRFLRRSTSDEAIEAMIRRCYGGLPFLLGATDAKGKRP